MNARLPVALFALMTALALAPSADAHTVNLRCDRTVANLVANPTQFVYPQAYIAQLDATDASTWTSGVAGVPIGNVDCSNFRCVESTQARLQDTVRPVGATVDSLTSPSFNFEGALVHMVTYCEWVGAAP